MVRSKGTAPCSSVPERQSTLGTRSSFFIWMKTNKQFALEEKKRSSYASVYYFLLFYLCFHLL